MVRSDHLMSRRLTWLPDSSRTLSVETFAHASHRAAHHEVGELIRSGVPDQARTVRATFVDREVPILRAPEPGGVAVEKRELCSTGVEVGVHEVCGADRGQVFRIKQPD